VPNKKKIGVVLRASVLTTFEGGKTVRTRRGKIPKINRRSETKVVELKVSKRREGM